MTGTTIDVEINGTSGLLHVHGDVTAASDSVFGDAYTEATAAGAHSLVLDFSDMAYMNSGGIGVLVTMLVRCQRGGQRLLATGLDAHYRQILTLTRLDEAIAVHDSEAAALASIA
jgi:anti-sigma B factor antagonist